MRLLAALLLLGCGSAQTPDPDPTPLASNAEGAELYGQYCALCHGERGEGYAADNATRLNGPGFLATASDDLLTVAIALGRSGTAMAGYTTERGGPLDEAQIAAVVAHIRSWQDGPAIDVSEVAVSGDAERGAHLFEQHCQSCHGALGDGGGSAQSLNRWAFLSEANDGFLRHAIVHGREGTPMPAFEESLEASQIDDLVVFLRTYEEEPHHLPEYLEPPALEAMTLIRNPDGEAPEFTLREERFVSAVQVRDAIGQGRRMVVLDARATSDWLVQRLPGALPVPYYMVTSDDPHDPDMAPLAERLPRDGTWIVAYCGCPHAASGAVVDALRELGFDHAIVLDEGVYHWIDQGYPTETGPVSAAPSP